MALIVQKYGGSSIADVERLNAVAQQVMATRAAGHQVVVVLSAMGNHTDELIALAHACTETPTPREYDLLLATGEQVSVALMAMLLNKTGCLARAYTGAQAGIITDTHHKKARITQMRLETIKKDISQHCIPVIAGFQGMDAAQNITTLGRGGSDTTAVAIASALAADECQIYTEVEGVYTADPRVVPSARLLARITFEEILELASLGAKVLQLRAVELAGKYNVPLRVLSSFVTGDGTLITYEDPSMEQPLVSGVAYDKDQAQLSLLGINNTPGTAAQLFQAIQEANILVDMIVQSPPDTAGHMDISFTVQRGDYQEALEVLHHMADVLKAKGVKGNEQVAKLSIVGVGMRSHLGVATTMFDALGREGINMLLITTSEIKVSVLIDAKYLELGARTLHAAFDLA
jgi:aspartate kinase